MDLIKPSVYIASMPGGRPTDYTPELGASLCADIAHCSELARGMMVHEACKKHGCSVSSFFLWLTKHPEFSEAYAHAREIRFEQLAEETLQIPDDVPTSWVWRDARGTEYNDEEYKALTDEEISERKVKLYGLSKEAVMAAELRVKARQWYLEKLSPKFGSKVAVTHKGDADAPPVFTIKIDNS